MVAGLEPLAIAGRQHEAGATDKVFASGHGVERLSKYLGVDQRVVGKLILNRRSKCLVLGKPAFPLYGVYDAHVNSSCCRQRDMHAQTFDGSPDHTRNRMDHARSVKWNS